MQGSWSIEASSPATNYALQTLSDIRYDSWRDYDAEASMRFYALRMHETGMIKSSPQRDHRQRHGLALPRRAEARVEDLSVMPTRRAPFEGRRGHANHPEPPPLPGRPAAAGTAGLIGTTTSRPGRATAGDDQRPLAAVDRWRLLLAAHVRCRRSCCAPRASPTSTTCMGDDSVDQSDVDCRWRDWISALNFAAAAYRVDRRTACRSRCWPGCTPGCLELIANDSIRRHYGPQGQEGRRRCT